HSDLIGLLTAGSHDKSSQSILIHFKKDRLENFKAQEFTVCSLTSSDCSPTISAMTRQLPWDRNALERTSTQRKQTATTPRRTATPNRDASRATTAAASPLDYSNHKPARSNGFLEGRSPSTSPPPEPLTETFMIDGLENDDKYRMVEDELVTIAGHFTAHLHAAEYQRLKAQTRTQNAETIKTISRPVVGSLTELARKRQEELLRKKKQREALRRAKRDAGRDDEDTGDETSVPWRGTSLQGLMHSPKKKEVPLMALTRTDSG
ncbi:hypothetical protein JMJ77_0014062, partial [Colletotrichum scovillei]